MHRAFSGADKVAVREGKTQLSADSKSKPANKICGQKMDCQRTEERISCFYNPSAFSTLAIIVIAPAIPSGIFDLESEDELVLVSCILFCSPTCMFP